jgi:hypothetical protein
VVTRDDEHRDASIGHPGERVERLIRERRDDSRPIEDVTCVHHEIDLARERRLERGGVVCEEIVTTPPSVDTWPDGQIEAEVGIGEEEDPDFVGYRLDDLCSMTALHLHHVAKLTALCITGPAMGRRGERGSMPTEAATPRVDASKPHR